MIHHTAHPQAGHLADRLELTLALELDAHREAMRFPAGSPEREAADLALAVLHAQRCSFVEKKDLAFRGIDPR